MTSESVPAGRCHKFPVTVRDARAEDEQFLYELYLSTRSEETKAWGLDERVLDDIMRLQFAGHQRHFSAQPFPVDHRIILVSDRPAGHVIVIRSDRENRLGDIALLPEHRGQGIGACFIEELFEEARATEKPLTLHVEKFNPAARLYQRMGFSVAADTGTHLRMEWNPSEHRKGDTRQ